jgi:hypothetical protein
MDGIETATSVVELPPRVLYMPLFKILPSLSTINANNAVDIDSRPLTVDRQLTVDTGHWTLNSQRNTQRTCTRQHSAHIHQEGEDLPSSTLPHLHRVRVPYCT